MQIAPNNRIRDERDSVGLMVNGMRAEARNWLVTGALDGKSSAGFQPARALDDQLTVPSSCRRQEA